jgi:hypothetical protein
MRGYISKSNPRFFFKFANWKQNSSGYPSAMFLGGACLRNAQEIADLFGEYFQCVNVKNNSQEGFVVDGVFEDSSTVSLEEETVQRALWLWSRKKARISPLILKKM